MMDLRYLPCPLLFLPLIASALDWQTRSLDLTTAPFQLTLDVSFEFRNNTHHIVTLRSVQTNCDCLQAKPMETSYPPGSSGTIKAQFTIGDHNGLYERIITVESDESPEPVQLLVRINVPSCGELTPRRVTWQRHTMNTEKIIEVNVTPGLEINFTHAQATTADFSARLETVSAGRHYRLHLQPGGTAEIAAAAIRIFGREKSGHDVVLSAYAAIE